MKRANYQRIAACYDENEFRQQVSKDSFLERTISENAPSPFRVLDLACGTGIYLNVQCAEFTEQSIEWHGFDASDAMLAIARQKVPGVTYAQGTAENLPYPDNFFDVVTCHFAFHHFPEKSQSLREISRVLREGGSVKILNIPPEEMPGWWLYAYFPKCVDIDQERFWPYAQIFRELEALGFSVMCTVTKTLSRIALATMLPEVQRRDTSQLDVLDDANFQHGLKQMGLDIEQGIESVVNEMAFVEIIAQKNS